MKLVRLILIITKEFIIDSLLWKGSVSKVKPGYVSVYSKPIMGYYGVHEAEIGNVIT